MDEYENEDPFFPDDCAHPNNHKKKTNGTSVDKKPKGYHNTAVKCKCSWCQKPFKLNASQYRKRVRDNKDGVMFHVEACYRAYCRNGRQLPVKKTEAEQLQAMA